MIAYFKMSEADRLALSNNQAAFIKAVELEAADRGIPLPTKLDEALALTGAKGLSIPADATRLFELCAKAKNYGGSERTGIAFRSEADALKALEGALAITESGYDASKKLHIANPFDSFEVRMSYIVHTPQKGYWTTLVEFSEDTEKFDKICEECRDDLEKIRQAAYDAQVTQARRQRYLELANGDEAVAANFWRNAFGTDFPAATAQPKPVN